AWLSGKATLSPAARTGTTAASAASVPATDAMVMAVRMVMVSPPWLAPRPARIRADAACGGHGCLCWGIFETLHGGLKMLVMLPWDTARHLFTSWSDLTHVR